MVKAIGYTCPVCGAQATTCPVWDDREQRDVSRVVVPHEPGCPVAERLAELRARRLAARP